MIGLLDCNNFYVSCERVFNPALNGRAVVALSNNDGCVIARSAEAKALNIKMGTPAFQIKNLIKNGTVMAFSSNYTLYGDMSRRVMDMLKSMVGKIEIYSIDEAFFGVPDNADFAAMGREIADRITRGTGIPVSIGIAPTKTLAKVANHCAKKYPGYKKVCVIQSERQRIAALKITPLDEVWGIGRRHNERLGQMGVRTAFDFASMPRDRVRRMMTVIGERTWCELRGVPCIDIENTPPDRRQICKSRSFGRMLTTYEELLPAVATFAAGCAEKLRAEKLCAAAVTVFVCTNRFRADLPQYAPGITVPLTRHTNDTRIIDAAARQALRQIYRPNYQYKKAGVIVSDILSCDRVPLDLFCASSDARGTALMTAMDDLNRKFGRGAVRMSAELTDDAWRNRHEMLSQNYTTDLRDIIEIACTDAPRITSD